MRRLHARHAVGGHAAIAVALSLLAGCGGSGDVPACGSVATQTCGQNVDAAVQAAGAAPEARVDGRTTDAVMGPTDDAPRVSMQGDWTTEVVRLPIGWTPNEQLTLTDRNIGMSLTIDDVGGTHLVFRGDNPYLSDTVYYAFKIRDGQWSPPISGGNHGGSAKWVSEV